MESECLAPHIIYSSWDLAWMRYQRKADQSILGRTDEWSLNSPHITTLGYAVRNRETYITGKIDFNMCYWWKPLSIVMWFSSNTNVKLWLNDNKENRYSIEITNRLEWSLICVQLYSLAFISPYCLCVYTWISMGIFIIVMDFSCFHREEKR